MAGLYDLVFRRRALTASAEPRRVLALPAAATLIDLGREEKVPVPSNNTWQIEAWSYYDDLGEFRYAVDWRAEMVSRVRLRAAKKVPGQDEPEILDKGVAADLVAELVEGSVGGPDHLMRSFATLLGVPGEGWLTGEEIAGGQAWRVRSADEIRKAQKPRIKWEVADDDKPGAQNAWRPLPNESLVARVWEPHPRRFVQADSPARAARGVLRELELVNRHIQALYLSRLASAGILLVPDEVDVPVRPEFQGLYNGLAMELLAVAQTAIQTPGSAAATVPNVLTGAAEYLKEIRFIDTFTKADEKLLEKRDSAIRRLATQMDLPAEVLLGMGDVNHWSAWQLEESGIKVHILPMVERICYGLLVGYLRPRLLAAKEDLADIVMWYDASEITMRPDRSEAAINVYDKLELSGEALRRETGFDESDKPEDEELERQILLRLALDPASAATALKALVGKELEPVATTPGQEPNEAENPQEAPEATGQENKPPETRNEPPPPPEESRRASAMAEVISAATIAQKRKANMRHWGRYQAITNTLDIEHPDECIQIPTPCPYGKAAAPKTKPGSSGTYEVSLVDGVLRIGKRRQDSPYANRRP